MISYEALYFARPIDFLSLIHGFQVVKGMCEMNPHIFKDHLRDFYPYITKLVCSEQVSSFAASSAYIIYQSYKM